MREAAGEVRSSRMCSRARSSTARSTPSPRRACRRWRSAARCPPSPEPRRSAESRRAVLKACQRNTQDLAPSEREMEGRRQRESSSLVLLTDIKSELKLENLWESLFSHRSSSPFSFRFGTTQTQRMVPIKVCIPSARTSMCTGFRAGLGGPG